MKHGRGKFIWSDKSTYDGDFFYIIFMVLESLFGLTEEFTMENG
jgi:hypothetical protein